LVGVVGDLGQGAQLEAVLGSDDGHLGQPQILRAGQNGFAGVGVVGGSSPPPPVCRLLVSSGTADVVDAAAIIAAISHGGAVLTSDPSDLRLLADAAGASVPLIVI